MDGSDPLTARARGDLKNTNGEVFPLGAVGRIRLLTVCREMV
ncbi:MAG: hypothetical protein PVG27_00130 [Chloroflexota bacterium]